MKICTVILGVLLAMSQPVFAQDKGKTMDHSKHVGEKIHESNVKGYHFSYHLVDLKKKAGRHLMVYIMNPEGKETDDAKVGFLVQGPDGSKQKLMAMGMKGAYGADVVFKIQGTYLIKMKAVNGGKKLFDSFEYRFE